MAASSDIVVDADCGMYTFSTINTLGSGSYSMVFQGHSVATNAPVAIKYTVKTHARRASAERHMRAERTALSRAHEHPNIVRLLGSADTPAACILVMEFVAGMQLNEYMRTVSRTRRREWFAQICSAVAYLHHMGIVHRDVKCENVMVPLCDGEPVKLIDFGFAAVIPDDKLFTDHPGTAMYAAPEIHDGRAYDARASDVWSLGVVLYIMMAMRFPFPNSTRIAAHICTGEPDYATDAASFDPGTLPLTQSMLAKSPGRRPTIDMIRMHSWVTEAATK
jgi:serine/threonine protein kinase